MLPLGFLLTQYTQTGYDACAHLSEETRGASKAAARGLWQAIFWSAVGGWILLVLFTFAATNVDFINNVKADNPYGAGYVVGIFASSLSTRGVQDRDGDRDDRPVLLRRLGHDERVADDVRVQPRPRGARAPAVVEGQQQSRTRQRHAR